MPELFGLYSLALSTILIFVAFSDLGIAETMTRFVSKELSNKKTLYAEKYISYLSRIKIGLMLLSSLLLVSFSRIISENYYHKPISLALLAGGFYIFFVGIVALMQSILHAYNDFRPIFFREMFFQVARTAIIPLMVIFALKKSYENETILFAIIFSLALIYLLSAAVLYYSSEKRIIFPYPKTSLSRNQKRKVNMFVIITSAAILSGVFFGYIDTVMLGYFVSSEYIGYYQIAFSFIGAIFSLTTFSAALLPVFTRAGKREMGVLFKNSLRFVFTISAICFLILFLAAEYVVPLIFGQEYIESVNVLKIFSLLLLTMPIITVYSTYFVSIGRPEIVTKALIFSTFANIVLNYALISYMVGFGEIYAVYGATIATIISRGFYMVLMVASKRS